MDIKRLTRKREATANVLSPDLPQWVSGDRKMYLAPAAVRAVAQNLIDEVHDHRHLRAAKLVIVMRTGVQPSADGRVELGKARRASPTLAFLSRGADFLVTLNAGEWQAGNEVTHLALADHELSHCGVAVGHKIVSAAAADKLIAKLGPRYLSSRPSAVGDGQEVIVYFAQEKAGKPVYAVRKHDVEEFIDVVARWGTWLTGLKRFSDAVTEAQARPAGDEGLFGSAAEAGD